VNPGNSGGPLINLSGQIIGINTAISTNSGGYDGVSFAIPINMVRGISDQLISTGTVKRSYLGIGLQGLDQELQDYFKVPEGGVLVTLVNKDTPASKAGVQLRDIIVELAGQKISSRATLMSLVDGLPVGKPQKMVVLRKGEKVDLTISPEQMPEGYTPALKGMMKAAPVTEQEEKTETKLGISVRAISPEIAEQLGLKDDVKGVVVVNTELGGAAQEAGIRRGDVITSVNEKPVTDKTNFGEALTAGDTKKGHLFEVNREGASILVVVHPTE
jgi:serine protease Do